MVGRVAPSIPSSHRITLALLTAAGVARVQTLVIPALPLLQREFHASTGEVTWLVTSFLVSSSVLTPMVGKLGVLTARSGCWL